MPLSPSAPRLLPLGDAAWTLEFGQHIAPELHARVMGLAARLQAWRGQGCAAGLAEALSVQDVVPSFRSLTVHFDPLMGDPDALGAQLLALAKAEGDQPPTGRRWCLPVCFDPEFAPDLPGLATACNLGQEEVLTQLTGALFRVYLIGFMPGFPYLGGLPSALAQPRLATPRKAVPARSLAVAGEMCCVYPWESPGGWRLLGRVPLPLFELSHEAEPAWLAAGDTVRWRAIDRTEFQRLERAWSQAELRRTDFLEPDPSPTCASLPPCADDDRT